LCGALRINAKWLYESKIMVSAALEFKCLVDNVFRTYIDSILGYSKLLKTIAIRKLFG
jgi:hypothetical protein